MDVRDAIRKRYSVRSYLDKPVEEEKLNIILESGRLAPSSGNRQDWKFIIVKDKKVREKLYEAASYQSFIKEAPIVIVGVSTSASYKMMCGIESGHIDVAIAMDHMSLQATELGIGTCWIGAFSQEKVKEILNIPKDCEVIELMTIGYPADKPREKIRKRIEDIIFYDKWG